MVFNAHTQNHGKLQNNVVDLADLVIPEDGSLWKRRGDALLPLDVVGDRQYYISLRYGRCVRPDLLRALLIADHA